MNTTTDNSLINQYIEQIQSLALLALRGENVDKYMEMVVNEACHFLSISQKQNPTSNLLLFKEKLTQMGEIRESNLPRYKRTLELAASLVVVR